MCSTWEVGKSIWEIEISITEIGKTLGEIGATVADVEKQRVKIYLFHCGAFLTFRGSTQVAPDSESTCGPSVCGIYFNTNLSNLTNRAG